METEKDSNQEEKESEEEKMEEEAEVKKDDLLLDLDPGDDDGGEIGDIVTEELLSSQVEEAEDDQREQLEEKGRELTKMLTSDEEYRGVELTTFDQVKDHSDPLGVNTQNDFKNLAIHDQKGTELSDHVNMDHNENNPINTTEANFDESHQAHQTNPLHKTSDADVNMDDERGQESENDFPVTDGGEEEHEEKKTAEREVVFVAEVPAREPILGGEDLRDREVKDKIHISEIPVHLHA